MTDPDDDSDAHGAPQSPVDGPPDGSHWPSGVRGVTETVVATLGPNDRWNHAALGVHATDRPSKRSDASSTGSDSTPTRAAAASTEADADALHSVTAYTYGNTRTRRNFHRRGGGVVQFTPDPVDFVDAALAVHETDDPVLASTAAWVRVDATQTATETSDGTRVETWRLDPVESQTRRRRVPVVDRGHAAVVEATVAASRLDVSSFDTDALRTRLDHALDVATTCGGERERIAIRRVADHTDNWNPPADALPDHPD